MHSATLGKGKSDDTLIKVKNGDLNNKGEITLVFGKQDTHVDRAGRSLIRDTFDDANITLSVSSPLDPLFDHPHDQEHDSVTFPIVHRYRRYPDPDTDHSLSKSKLNTLSSVTNRVKVDGMPLYHDRYSG